ncbi:MAG: hypothetical protein GXY85_08620 [Candidatus Brocadiaceae bacterium]|nr:hypothetical protein [Candidatus Brocadiaceae bacterium]
MDVDRQEPRRRSGCWVVLAVCVALLMALIAGLWAWDAALHRRLDARIAANRAKGQPVTFDEFLDRRWQAAPPECSADAILDALWELESVGSGEGERPGVIDEFDPPNELGVRWSDERRQMMREHVEARAGALAMIRRAAALPVGAYPVDASGSPWAIEMRYLPGLRQAARLSRRAAVLCAENGDGRAAAEYTADGLVIPRSVGEWPFESEWLVGVAACWIALGGLEHSLALCEVPAESLTTLREALRAIEGESRLETVLIAARAMGHHSLVEASGSDLADLLFMEFVDRWDTKEDIVILIYALAPIWRIKDALFFHRLMDAQIDVCRLPLEERVEGGRRVGSEVETALTEAGAWRYPLTGRVLPALTMVGEEEAKLIAHLRVARVALAAEQWRMAHGRWPDSPGQLVPGILDELPSDPFTGGPLRWARADAGLTIYSVGLDGADQGGISWEEAQDFSDCVEQPHDIPFRLLDPERRGARRATFREEVLAAGLLSLQKLEAFGFTEERLRGLGFSDDDLHRLSR